MASRVAPRSQIRLARQPGRLLVAPALISGAGLLLVGLGAAYAAGGVLLGLIPVAVGTVAILAGGWLAAVVLSARLEVEVAELRLHWLGRESRFRLAPGSLTRVTVGGRGRPRLRSRFGALGWALGGATLNDEPITVVRLAARRPLVMIPTDQGRLAVVAADERELVEALTAAARVQQRLDQAMAMARPVPIAVSAPPTALAGAVLPVDAAGLTGIERAQLERQLATQRSVAMVVAESERREAAEAALTGRYEPVAAAVVSREPVVAVARPSRPRQRANWHRPAWLALRLPGTARASLPAGAAHRSATQAATAVAPPPVVAPRLRLPALPVPSLRLPVPRFARGRGRPLLVMAPVVVSGLTWLVAGWLELLPAEAEGLRTVAVAIALGGPVALAGSILAWIRFPRLAGLVAASGLVALVLVGRSLVG